MKQKNFASKNSLMDENSDGGRTPHSLELMVCIYFLQLWHNLSDPAMEEAIYNRLSFQKFLGLNFVKNFIK